MSVLAHARVCPACVAAELTRTDVAGLPSERASLADLEHPAIGYLSKPANDVVTQLDRRLTAGEVQLAFTAGQGYLPAVLERGT